MHTFLIISLALTFSSSGCRPVSTDSNTSDFKCHAPTTPTMRNDSRIPQTCVDVSKFVYTESLVTRNNPDGNM